MLEWIKTVLIMLVVIWVALFSYDYAIYKYMEYRDSQHMQNIYEQRKPVEIPAHYKKWM